MKPLAKKPKLSCRTSPTKNQRSRLGANGLHGKPSDQAKYLGGGKTKSGKAGAVRP